MTAYYNEFDKNAAAWLRELIKHGLIADGDVDERSIEDVLPSDLRGYTQCHFFAGIGVWSYALRNAGWTDDRPVWTGSCPCQPFSAAGKGAAFADERHLWPAFFHLIKECRPERVFGEQVASKDADAWIDLVQDDMEGLGYPFGAVPFPSAGVGAPHIRDRAYWVADANDTGLEGRAAMRQRAVECFARTGGVADRMADPKFVDCGCEAKAADHRQQETNRSADWVGGCGGSSSGMADNETSGRREECADAGRIVVGDRAQGRPAGFGNGGSDSRTGTTNGHWRDADWLFCRDGKWRPVEPGTFPLVARTPSGVVPSSGIGLPIDANRTGEARVMRLRGYGNAINAVAAQAFIEAFMECRP